MELKVSNKTHLGKARVYGLPMCTLAMKTEKLDER